MKISVSIASVASATIFGYFLSSCVSAFVVVPAARFTTTTTSSSFSSSSKLMALDQATILDMESARAAFVLCFFGAVGSAAVGREVIPVTIRENKKLQELVGQGQATIGGTEMDLFGYPEPVYEEDVWTIINNNNMTIYEMVEAYPVQGQVPGMLRFESLAKANKDVSQVAVRAVFDAIAIGINKNSVAPRAAIAKLEEFKRSEDGLSKLKSNSQLSKTIGVLALCILLGLIGSADYFALFHLIHGWFPEWSGKESLPLSLLDVPKMTTLPDCFINDIPDKSAAAAAATAATDAFPM